MLSPMVELMTFNEAKSSTMKTVLAHSMERLEWQRDIYKRMHQHPELSGTEQWTAQMICNELDQFDCKVTTHIGGYGIVAVFHNGDGPCVLMRADFDGLPVLELTGAEFASTRKQDRNGTLVPVMHACGHDMHTTALLGCCAALNAHRDAWSGTFVALFQPSEENGQGAAAMVADGLGRAIPRPDVCFGQHIVPGPAGQVMTMPGPALAACDSIEIIITGRSAHGSMPHNAIDPTYIASMIVIRLQGIVGREIPPDQFAVVSVGTLESGNSNNTIPGTARIVVNCRMYDEGVRDTLYSAIERVVRAECAAQSTTVDPTFRYFAHGPLTSNNSEVFAAVRPQLDAHFGDKSTQAEKWTASEDFSNIPDAFQAPYLFWTVGCTPQQQWEAACEAGTIDQDIPVNHSGTFLPDFVPTVTSSTQAAIIAVLSYLSPDTPPQSDLAHN
ncbi:amidohydrolase [Corynebacterium diphtheriae]|nr:amidohydrolase [Corynebacterium diphtheriae]CAB1040933.1 amidohydrolase [Corynebacterium diphtheriae]